jgi:hypothetical protein
MLGFAGRVDMVLSSSVASANLSRHIGQWLPGAFSGMGVPQLGHERLCGISSLYQVFKGLPRQSYTLF